MNPNTATAFFRIEIAGLKQTAQQVGPDTRVPNGAWLGSYQNVLLKVSEFESLPADRRPKLTYQILLNTLYGLIRFFGREHGFEFWETGLSVWDKPPDKTGEEIGWASLFEFGPPPSPTLGAVAIS